MALASICMQSLALNSFVWYNCIHVHSLEHPFGPKTCFVNVDHNDMNFQRYTTYNSYILVSIPTSWKHWIRAKIDMIHAHYAHLQY